MYRDKRWNLHGASISKVLDKPQRFRQAPQGFFQARCVAEGPEKLKDIGYYGRTNRERSNALGRRILPHHHRLQLLDELHVVRTLKIIY